jgi:flagellar biosynthesis/type III secretory pathway ATPase
MPVSNAFLRLVEAMDLDELERDLAEVDRRIAELTKERQDIAAALRLGRSQTGSEPQVDRSMSRRDAVVFLLARDPSRSWDADEIIEELVRVGYLSADEDVSRSVRSQLSALHREKKIDRVERGRYRAGGP